VQIVLSHFFGQRQVSKVLKTISLRFEHTSIMKTYELNVESTFVSNTDKVLDFEMPVTIFTIHVQSR